MSEADATLRVKQARKRIIEIKNLLADLQSLNISKRKQNDSKKKFISPQDLDVASSRWNSFLINAGRQHFGIKQKVRIFIGRFLKLFSIVTNFEIEQIDNTYISQFHTV